VPIELTVQQLGYMLERRGCDLSLSFGAFDKDDLIGFILNGVRQWHGELTAYDTGTGLVKEYRRKGIATRLFKESLPHLKQHHITHYVLEVLKNNISAINLYKKEGFAVTREFDCYISPKSEINMNGKNDAKNMSVRHIKIPDWDLFRSFWDVAPSWQNSIDSIIRKLEYFTILGIFEFDRIIGYGFIENHTGDIPQIAIAQSHRRQGLATQLMKNLFNYSESEQIRIININSDYAPFKHFAESINLKPVLGQYEMVLAL